MAPISERLDSLIKEKKVFVVSKSYCPFCVTAKKVLDEYDIPPDFIEVMEIENMRECNEIQDHMMKLTGGRTVPRVFVGGEFIGGGTETAQLHQSKKLGPMLKKVGAIL